MRWLWGTLAGVIVGVLFALVFRRAPLAQIKREWEAIEAGRIAAEDAARRGAVTARQEIEDEHAATIHAFNERQRKKLYRLRSDPAALARWLTRISQ